MAGNSDGLQEMYEYKEMKGKDGYEYVVRGAEVFCGQGSQSCIMQLPKDHGIYSSDGRPLIRNTDIGKENISGFGIWSLCNRGIDMKKERRKKKEVFTYKLTYDVTFNIRQVIFRW